MPDVHANVAELYRAHAPGLLAFLYARLKDLAWAEDVLHDVFVGYLRQDARRIANAKAYLFSAAHRTSLMALRDRRRGTRHELAAGQPWAVRQGADPQLTVALRDALESLPTDQREVLLLRTYGPMTFEEISNVLEEPLSRVYRRYQDAVEQMRRICDADAPVVTGKSKQDLNP